MKICKFALLSVFGFIVYIDGATGYATALPATGALVVSASVDVQVRSNASTVEHNFSANQSTTLADAGQL
jgi:hypothetical protein